MSERTQEPLIGTDRSVIDELRLVVEAVQTLIEAGDDIRCYPSGAVGFDEWYEATAAAQLLIGRWVDEDGTWRPIDDSEGANG